MKGCESPQYGHKPYAFLDKVRMYEEIMTNDDNLESNLLTSSLLKMCCLVQVELCVYCPVAGDELRELENDSCTLNLLAITVYPEV